MTMRAALYVRCSTDKQETENQLSQLIKWAESQSWIVSKVYEEIGSGKTADRKQFQQMFIDAEHRRFDVLCFWALDRLTREGPLATLLHLEKLSACGIKVKSFSEPWLDTTSAMGELLVPIFAWVAKQERQRLVDRTKAGLETARRRGKRLGRPEGTRLDVGAVVRLSKQGLSTRAIASEVGCSKSAVQLIVAELRRTSPAVAASVLSV